MQSTRKWLGRICAKYEKILAAGFHMCFIFTPWGSLPIWGAYLSNGLLWTPRFSHILQVHAMVDTGHVSFEYFCQDILRHVRLQLLCVCLKNCPPQKFHGNVGSQIRKTWQTLGMRGSFSKSAWKIEMCPAPFSNLSVSFGWFFAETENEICYFFAPNFSGSKLEKTIPSVHTPGWTPHGVTPAVACGVTLSRWGRLLI